MKKDVLMYAKGLENNNSLHKKGETRENCGITVEAGLDWDVECSGCEVLSAMEVRFKLPVTLNDENTSMISTIKSPDAEKLIPFAPSEVMKKQEEVLIIPI